MPQELTHYFLHPTTTPPTKSHVHPHGAMLQDELGNLITSDKPSTFSLDCRSTLTFPHGEMPQEKVHSTPVNAKLLNKLLLDYPDGRKIASGFHEGFEFHFMGDECYTSCKNSKSANLNPSAIDEKIHQEISKGRIAGPFTDPPFPNFKCSPLSLREKSQPGTYRLLHNLSYPYDSSSVNGGIPQEYKTVKYSTIQSAIQVVNELGRGCYMAKADIKSAYRIVPIHPKFYHLLGFKWRGLYFYDKFLPMGLAESCALFEKISDAVKYIMNSFGINHIVKILDDFLILEQTKQQCDLSLQKFKFIAECLGIPLAQDKTSVQSSQQIVFLGIHLNTSNMTSSLPQDKLARYAADIEHQLRSSTSSVQSMLQLIGKLQFSTSVVPIGKPFLRRMIDSIRGLDLNMKVTLTEGMCEDLQLWLSFLRSYNGITMIYTAPPFTNEEIGLYTDASNMGFAATFGSHWIQGHWNPLWRQLNIAVRELYPILAIVGIFGHLWKNHTIIFNCDNQAIVASINKQSARDPTIMKLLRPLILSLMLNNIKFKSVYIKSKDNVLADALSRFQQTDAMLLQHGLRQDKTEIPASWLPDNFIA